MSWWLWRNLGFSRHKPIKYNAQVVNNKVGEMEMAFKEEERRREYVMLNFFAQHQPRRNIRHRDVGGGSWLPAGQETQKGGDACWKDGVGDDTKLLG